MRINSVSANTNQNANFKRVVIVDEYYKNALKNHMGSAKWEKLQKVMEKSKNDPNNIVIYFGEVSEKPFASIDKNGIAHLTIYNRGMRFYENIISFVDHMISKSEKLNKKWKNDPYFRRKFVSDWERPR